MWQPRHRQDRPRRQPTVELTFWQQKFEDYQQAWFKKEVDAFNASQTKVKVDYQVVPA